MTYVIPLVVVVVVSSTRNSKFIDSVHKNSDAYFLAVLLLSVDGGQSGVVTSLSCIIIKVFVKRKVLSIETIVSARTHTYTH